jgi:hypothetical protein
MKEVHRRRLITRIPELHFTGGTLMALRWRIVLPLLLIAVLVLATASIMVGVTRTNTTGVAGLALVPVDAALAGLAALPVDALLAGIALNGLD